MIDNTTILIVSAASSVTYGGDPGALIALGAALLPPLALYFLLERGAGRLAALSRLRIGAIADLT
jgi:hypothetical protein